MLAPLGSAPKQPVGTERRALLGSSCFAVEGKVQALAVAGASHWGRAVGAGRSSSCAAEARAAPYGSRAGRNGTSLVNLVRIVSAQYRNRVVKRQACC